MQEKVQTAAGEATKYQIDISREDTAQGVELLREKGVEVYEPSPEELDAFKAATKPSFDKWSTKIGPEIVKLLTDEAAVQ